jgi:hypothetical protein
MITFTDRSNAVLTDQGFTQTEIDRIQSFLGRGFNPDGQTEIISIIMLAKEGPTFNLDRVMSVLESRWKEVWQAMSPEERGATNQGENKECFEFIMVELNLRDPINLQDTRP